jgi:hypothetical protein
VVDTVDIESTLQASLEAVFRGGDGLMARRLAKIEESMWQTFQALPKNAVGRLAPRSVRYMVHNFFAKEHGWLINGMEPDTMQPNATELHEMTILQDKAPAFVESLLEARQSDRGLSLSDVVAMVVALERLIFDESIKLLEAAYTLNGQQTSDVISEDALHEVLTSYLLIFEQGKVNLTDIRRHSLIKEKMALSRSSWSTLVEYEKDAVTNFHYRNRDQMNPFVTRQYSFSAASTIVEDLAQGYGKWQNTECRQMKEHLMELDVDGSGRVPISAFYSQSENEGYQFTESTDYLRQIGALDEPVIGSPKVRIANYLAGPSNCIASSTYYSVCCLSDCEGLRNDVEGKIKAPVASPEHLLSIVGNLSSSSVDAPRKLPRALADKLQAIADRHSGLVPLHGRLFAQWMHYAFPSECPYPHIAESQAALTATHCFENKRTVTSEEKRLHLESGNAAETEEPAMSQWTDDEILPLHEPPQNKMILCRSVLRTVMQFTMLFVALRIALSTWRAAPVGAGWKNKNDDGFVLPMRL